MTEYLPLCKASGRVWIISPPPQKKCRHNEFLHKFPTFEKRPPKIKKKKKKKNLMMIEGRRFFLTWSWWCQKTYSGGSGLNWTMQVRLTWLPTSTWNSGPPRITALGAGSVQKIFFFSQRHTIKQVKGETPEKTKGHCKKRYKRVQFCFLVRVNLAHFKYYDLMKNQEH